MGSCWKNLYRYNKNSKTINLNRYTFNENGNPTAQGENIISNYYQELSSSDKGTTVSKNITDFKNSVSTNGGYYIGRYEARTTTERSSEDDTLTQITEKGTNPVYNYVTQIQAAEQAQNMYNSSKFTSDLMNSYAWDTATLFLQTCGEEKYSIKTSVNKSLASKGTNSSDYTGTRDTVCNVYDMASNIRELTTETSNGSDGPCVSRGGDCFISTFDTSCRDDNGTSNSNDNLGFRPLLFV